VSPSPAQDAGVEAFAADIMCRSLDRALVKKITGPTLGRDISLKQGQPRPMSGLPAEGPTCMLEGGRGEVETSVFTEPTAVARRKALVAQGCTTVDVAPWDLAWKCQEGPILIRFGKDSVFTCFTSQARATAQADALGRAVCDDLLDKIS
jgi:hypothetical protein